MSKIMIRKHFLNFFNPQLLRLVDDRYVWRTFTNNTEMGVSKDNKFDCEKQRFLTFFYDNTNPVFI